MQLSLDTNVTTLASSLNFNEDSEKYSYETLLELVKKLTSANAEQKETLDTSHKLVQRQRTKFNESKNIISAEKNCLEMKNERLEMENERLKKENECLKKNEIIHNRIFLKIEKEKQKELIVCTATQPEVVPLLHKNIQEYINLHNQLVQSNSKLAGSTG